MGNSHWNNMEQNELLIKSLIIGLQPMIIPGLKNFAEKYNNNDNNIQKKLFVLRSF